MGLELTLIQSTAHKKRILSEIQRGQAQQSPMKHQIQEHTLVFLTLPCLTEIGANNIDFNCLIFNNHTTKIMQYYRDKQIIFKQSIEFARPE